MEAINCSEEELLEICAKLKRQAERLERSGLPQGINLDDLESVGQEAVVKALKSFRPAENHAGIPIQAYVLKASLRAMYNLIRKERRRNCKRKPLILTSENGDETIPFPDRKVLSPIEIAEAKEKLKFPSAGLLTLTEIKASLPSAIETAKAVENLRQAIFGSVSVQDVEQIMRSMLSRAKEGNVPAARLILEQINGKATPVTITHIVASDVNLAEVHKEMKS